MTEGTSLIAPAIRNLTGGYDGKTVAITGSGGFIGASVAERLALSDCRILRVTREDAADASVWQRVSRADVIFHFGAQTSAAVAAADPEKDFAANVLPMRRLLEAAALSVRPPVVIFAGTVTQTGVQKAVPVNENVADHPITVYDRHKLLAEGELKRAAAAALIRGASLRLSNVYGPGAHQRTGDRQVLNRMIRKALDGGTLPVYGTGNYLRDYIFIDDVVDAFLIAALCIDRINGRHFIIGSGHGTTVRDAFELIAARVRFATGTQVAVVTTASQEPLSAIERRDFVADSSAFSEATGWHPRWALECGIDRTIKAALCA